MIVPRCRHIKTNGLVCQSPALKDEKFCFFHERFHGRQHDYREASGRLLGLKTFAPLELSVLEDSESVQVAISVVVNALAIGDITADHARALLYGLQLAAANVRNLNLRPASNDVVRETAPNYNGFDLALEGAELEIFEFDTSGVLTDEEANFMRVIENFDPHTCRNRTSPKRKK